MIVIGSPLFVAIAASSGFRPDRIAGLKLWLDAGQNVTVTGSGVSLWGDSTGQGNDVAQGSDANRPALISSWRNGRPAIQGALGKNLRLDAFTSGALSQGNTVFAVTGWHTGSAAYLFDGAVDVAERHAVQTTATQARMYSGLNFNSGSNPASDSSPTVCAFTYDGAASRMDFWPQGEAVFSTTGDAGAQSFDGITIGDARALGGTNWIQPYAEFLIYDSVLSAGDRDAVATYLQSKYDITPV